jgi:hypothetical protein
MIYQVGEGNRLTIGEGVETTLAALQLGLLQLGLSYNRDQPELRSRIHSSLCFQECPRFGLRQTRIRGPSLP